MSARHRSNTSVRRQAGSMLFVFMRASPGSHASRGAWEHSAAQARPFELNPCGAAPILASQTKSEIPTSLKRRPHGKGTTTPSLSTVRYASKFLFKVGIRSRFRRRYSNPRRTAPTFPESHPSASSTTSRDSAPARIQTVQPCKATIPTTTLRHIRGQLVGTPRGIGG